MKKLEGWRKDDFLYELGRRLIFTIMTASFFVMGYIYGSSNVSFLFVLGLFLSFTILDFYQAYKTIMRDEED